MEQHHAKPSHTDLLAHNEKMISYACVRLQKHLLEAQMNNVEGIFGLEAIIRDSKIKSLQLTTKEKI